MLLVENICWRYFCLWAGELQAFRGNILFLGFRRKPVAYIHCWQETSHSALAITYHVHSSWLVIRAHGHHGSQAYCGTLEGHTPKINPERAWNGTEATCSPKICTHTVSEYIFFSNIFRYKTLDQRYKALGLKFLGLVLYFMDLPANLIFRNGLVPKSVLCWALQQVQKRLFLNP